VTFEGDNEDPVWSPDGSRIAFASERDGTEGSDLWVKRVDNTEPARPLRTMAGDQWPSMWPADTLLLVTTDGAGNRDIGTWILPALSPSASSDSVRVEPFLRADWDEDLGRLSPDGRLMAIVSDETGEYDIWLRSFPDPTGQWRVTSGGSGRAPRWSPDGARLFFTIPGTGGPVDTLVSIAVERDPIRLTDRRVELVTDFAGVFNWDLHPDGDRFLVRVNTTATPAASTSPEGEPGEERYLVVLNWVSEMLATLEGN
jgi:dipeptidyl aminopeptidase/acylaminoacyl peptidase